jgi:hypothetical protein
MSDNLYLTILKQNLSRRNYTYVSRIIFITYWYPKIRGIETVGFNYLCV